MTATSLLASCSCEEKEMRTNALGYLQAVGDYHMDDALPYCTRQTQEKTIPVLKQLLEIADTAYVNSNRPSVFTIQKIRRIDDTSARVYYHKHTPIKDINDSLLLLFENGRWLAEVRLGPIPFLNSNRDTNNATPPKLEIPKDPNALRMIPADSLPRRRNKAYPQ